MFMVLGLDEIKYVLKWKIYNVAEMITFFFGVGKLLKFCNSFGQGQLKTKKAS